jgi:hypothetical protein
MPLAHLSKSEAKRFGLPKKNLQTILFKKDGAYASLKESRDWLKKHGYLYQNYRSEGEHRRFQQNNPILGAKYYAKKLTPDITMIFQDYS